MLADLPQVSECGSGDLPLVEASRYPAHVTLCNRGCIIAAKTRVPSVTLIGRALGAPHVDQIVGFV